MQSAQICTQQGHTYTRTKQSLTWRWRLDPSYRVIYCSSILTAALQCPPTDRVMTPLFLFQRKVPGLGRVWCPDTRPGWRPETRCGPPAAARAPGLTRTPPSARTRPRPPPVPSSDTRQTSRTRKRRPLYASVKTMAVTMTRGKTKTLFVPFYDGRKRLKVLQKVLVTTMWLCLFPVQLTYCPQ